MENQLNEIISRLEADKRFFEAVRNLNELDETEMLILGHLIESINSKSEK